MIATSNQLQRVSCDWNRYAKGEDVAVEQIKGTIYGYSTELGCLRLLAIYRGASHFRMGFSSNMNTWYVSLDLPTC